MPSFRRLPDAAFCHRESAREDETEPVPPQPRHDLVAARRQTGGEAEWDRGERSLPPRPQPRPLLLACLFAAGIATGLGIAHVLGDAAIPGDIGSARAPAAASLEQLEHRMGAGLLRGASAEGDLVTKKPPAGQDSATGLPPSPNFAVSRDEWKAARPPAEVRALSARMDRMKRQIAANRLDEPEGDNALDTYRQIAAQWPDDAARAGQHLRAVFWRRAENARAAAQWDEALHYLNVLKTLPPVLPTSGAASDEAGIIGSTAAPE